MLSQERRDLALEAGRFGRAASLYNLLSRTEVFGLKPDECKAEIDRMLSVVGDWKRHFTLHGVEQRSIEMLEQAPHHAVLEGEQIH